MSPRRSPNVGSVVGPGPWVSRLRGYEGKMTNGLETIDSDSPSRSAHGWEALLHTARMLMYMPMPSRPQPDNSDRTTEEQHELGC